MNELLYMSGSSEGNLEILRDSVESDYKFETEAILFAQSYDRWAAKFHEQIDNAIKKGLQLYQNGERLIIKDLDARWRASLQKLDSKDFGGLISKGRHCIIYSSSFSEPTRSTEYISRSAYITKEESNKYFIRPKNLEGIVVERIKGFKVRALYLKIKNREKTLGVSHYFAGWSEKPFNTHINLSIQYSTNFGYGKSSYFFTILKYKEVPILRCQNWIKFSIADVKFVKGYSFSHELSEKSWLEAMKCSLDASSQIRQNEAEFVDNYIINDWVSSCQLVAELFDITPEDYSEEGYSHVRRYWDLSSDKTIGFDLAAVVATRCVILVRLWAHIAEYVKFSDYEMLILPLQELIIRCNVLVDLNYNTLNNCREITQFNVDFCTVIAGRVDILQPEGMCLISQKKRFMLLAKLTTQIIERKRELTQTLGRLNAVQSVFDTYTQELANSNLSVETM